VAAVRCVYLIPEFFRRFATKGDGSSASSIIIQCRLGTSISVCDKLQKALQLYWIRKYQNFSKHNTHNIKIRKFDRNEKKKSGNRTTCCRKNVQEINIHTWCFNTDVLWHGKEALPTYSCWTRNICLVPSITPRCLGITFFCTLYYNQVLRVIWQCIHLCRIKTWHFSSRYLQASDYEHLSNPFSSLTVKCTDLTKLSQQLKSSLQHVNTIPQVKGKAIPLQAWAVPEGSRRLRLPDFQTISTWRW